MKGIIYLLKFEKDKSEIHKVGRTTNLKTRLAGYTQVYEFVCAFQCSNVVSQESKILKLFNDQFENVKSIGKEYFKGDEKSMIYIIQKECAEILESPNIKAKNANIKRRLSSLKEKLSNLSKILSDLEDTQFEMEFYLKKTQECFENEHPEDLKDPGDPGDPEEELKDTLSDSKNQQSDEKKKKLNIRQYFMQEYPKDPSIWKHILTPSVIKKIEAKYLVVIRLHEDPTYKLRCLLYEYVRDNHEEYLRSMKEKYLESLGS